MKFHDVKENKMSLVKSEFLNEYISNGRRMVLDALQPGSSSDMARSVFILPYGMLLTHLFNHVTAEYPRLQSPQNVLVDRVMLSLGAPRQRKPRKDIGVKRTRHSTSSSTAFDHDSFSHQVDDDENRGDEGTSRVSTPSPTTYFNSLSQNIPQVFSNPLPHEQNHG
ncbi:hypothetical protein Tco_0227576 [Tanacetum coccineum]